MKALAAILISLFLFVTPAFADEVVEPLIFEFTQDGIENVDGWYVHIASSENGNYTKVTDANGQILQFAKADAVQTPEGYWQFGQPFMVTGNPNTTETRWFKLSAYGMNQNNQEVESSLSSSASYDFKFPLSMQIPVLIRVRAAEE